MKRALAIKKIFTQKNGKHSLSASLPSIMFAILFVFTFFSCKSPTAPGSKSISLFVKDVSCTEAWLNLTASNITLPANILIKKNGNSFLNLTLTQKNSAIYDSTLSPSQTYTYQAEYSKGFAFERSETVTTRTLDTTSSNFSWQTFTFGAALTSHLSDICIVNDTLIYATGEIYLYDSTGKIEPTSYNLAKWNGHSWQFLRMQFYLNCGQQLVDGTPTTAVFALNDKEIWIASETSRMTIWDGTYQINNMCLPVSVSKIWAANANEIYTVGVGGQMGYYTNGDWQKLNSGTNIQIFDIWGITNSITNLTEIFTVSSDIFYKDQRRIFLMNSTSVDSLPTPAGPDLYTVWAASNRLIYVGGSGLWRYASGNWNKVSLVPGAVVISVRGNAANDVFAVGTFGLLAHFNGVSWKLYDGVSDATFGSVCIKGNMLAAVGEKYGTAVVIIGKRN